MNPAQPVAIVAGSGLALRPLLDTVEWERSFSQFDGLAHAQVPGHDSVFIKGTCGSTPLLIQVGRRHIYEGLAYPEVTRSVDVLAGLGATAVLFTNAAGGLDPAMPPGALMAVTEVLTWPYQPWTDHDTVIAPDLVLPHCPFSGRYLWVPGPNYETRAEIAAMRSIGAAAVGMSAAPELHRARERGLRTAVVSCVTNNCCVPQTVTHDEVLRTARIASETLVARIRSWLPLLSGK